MSGGNEAQPGGMPLERSRALEVERYVGAEVMTQDARAIFGSSWQLVAHVGQLREAGDHGLT